MNDNELMHYGVLGMKWGVRKAAKRYPSVRTAKKQARKDNRDYSRAFDQYSRTWVGKNRRTAATNNVIRTAEKSAASDKAYKKAYKSAKNSASKKIYKEGYDKGAAGRVSKMSTGKAVVQAALLGSYGALKYNEYKAKGVSTGKSVTKAILNNWANNVTFGAIGREENLRRYLNEKSR